MPDHPPEPGSSAEQEPAARPAERAGARERATPTGARRACPRCGAALGALSAEPGDAESLYCGCCGLVLPSPAASA